jgi:hypothetical protein
MRASANTDIVVLAGMEITSAEEVHTIALFNDLTSALQLQEIVYKHLNPGENKEELFGEQIIANEFDEVDGYCKRLLIGATTLSLETIVAEIHNLGGLAIAAHVDRESFSIIGQLGFIPDNLDLDGVELSTHMSRSQAIGTLPGVERFPIIHSSDAHLLQDIGAVTTSFYLKEPRLDEIRKAFNNEEGRKIVMEAGG